MLILAWALGVRIPKASATALLLSQKPDPASGIQAETAVLQSHILPALRLHSHAAQPLAGVD